MTSKPRLCGPTWMIETKIKTKIKCGTWDGLNLQNVWLMHSNLSIAAEKINNCYSIQLLLWIIIFSMSVLTRLYTIMNYRENLMFVILRDTICGLGIFLNLVLIIFSCHITSLQVSQLFIFELLKYTNQLMVIFKG